MYTHPAQDKRKKKSNISITNNEQSDKKTISFTIGSKIKIPMNKLNKGTERPVQ
jgi:hypothetical protein